jgi:hypothetical protein
MNESEEKQWFLNLQKQIENVLLKDGYSQKQSEELSFFVAQAVRDVPRLLTLLEKPEDSSTEEIMDAIHLFLSNQFAFQEANKILMREET